MGNVEKFGDLPLRKARTGPDPGKSLSQARVFP
jgi:hypothetical protein